MVPTLKEIHKASIGRRTKRRLRKNRQQVLSAMMQAHNSLKAQHKRHNPVCRVEKCDQLARRLHSFLACCPQHRREYDREHAKGLQLFSFGKKAVA